MKYTAENPRPKVKTLYRRVSTQTLHGLQTAERLKANGWQIESSDMFSIQFKKTTVEQPKRFYVGISATGRIAFKASNPTQQTHGRTYTAVIGPFITKRAAKFCAKYGAFSQCQTVAEFEKAAKLHIETEGKI
jgi:hypothetical protein